MASDSHIRCVMEFSIGILSWKGYDSLAAALATYEENGLHKLTDTRLLCLPEAEQAGRDLAKKYGYETHCPKQNLGIYGNFKAMAAALPAGPVLLLENDLPLIEAEKTVLFQINYALTLLQRPDIIKVRLRSRHDPGEDFTTYDKYLRLWRPDDKIAMLKRWLHPRKAQKLIGTSIYADAAPARRHPRWIEDVGRGFYAAPTKVLSWTNQSILIDRDFFLNTILAQAGRVRAGRLYNGFRNIETQLNRRWWRQQDWNIAVAPGLFTHRRLSHRGY